MTYDRQNAGAAALEFARELNGRPYIYGGTWPQSGGTDCSGLTEWAYGKVGIELPRTTYEQYLIHPLARSVQSEPGDLLFIAGSDPIGNEPGHVMIYVEEGEVFQAPFTGEKIGQYPYDTSVFEYRTRPALALPIGKPTTKNPTKKQIETAGLVLLANPTQAHLAINNGWTVWHWGGSSFVHSTLPLPKGTPEYANKNFRTKH